jgi:group I intron endonuclease
MACPPEPNEDFYFMTVIYKIVSPKGKVYIGSTSNFKKRYLQYRSMSSTSTQYKLKHSFKKYGFENHVFTIVCECTNENRYELENYYGILFNCIGNEGLNLQLPLKTDIYKTVDVSVSKKISIANSLRVVKDSTKQKIREARTGSKLSEYHKRKISEGGKGRIVTQSQIIKTLETRKTRVYDYTQSSINGSNNKGKKRTIQQVQKMSEVRIGCTQLQSTKDKISLANSGKIRTTEQRQKISKARKGNEYPRLILLNIETGIYYFGIKEAANSINVSYDVLFGRIRCKKSPFIKCDYIIN